MLTLVGYSQGLGFIGVWTLASACALCLPTNSVKIFQVGLNFRLQVKSKTRVHSGEHRRVMKLEVWPSELAFRVDSQDGKARFSSVRYASWCKSIFKMGHKMH